MASEQVVIFSRAGVTGCVGPGRNTRTPVTRSRHVVFSVQDIDQKISLLGAKLPSWAGPRDEGQEARLHCLKRTGCMVPTRRQIWPFQKGRRDSGECGDDSSVGSR